MKRFFMSFVTVLVVLSTVGCGKNSSSTILEFSFSTSEAADSSDEKVLYFNENKDRVVMNAQLEIDSGSATLQITDTTSDEIVWSNTYDKNDTFDIELEDIVSGSEYKFTIQTDQSKRVHLIVTSTDNLVKEVEKPEK